MAPISVPPLSGQATDTKADILHVHEKANQDTNQKADAQTNQKADAQTNHDAHPQTNHDAHAQTNHDAHAQANHDAHPQTNHDAHPQTNHDANNEADDATYKTPHTTTNERKEGKGLHDDDDDVDDVEVYVKGVIGYWLIEFVPFFQSS